jgi:hypothetical protein
VSTPVCDFCDAPSTIWRYPCSSFRIEELDWSSNGDWLACEECAALIEADHLYALAMRSLLLHRADLTGDQLATMVRVKVATYTVFRAWATGPRRPA